MFDVEAYWSSYIDHDERIPLFMKSTENDPDLPYVPLLKYVSQSNYAIARLIVYLLLGISKPKMNSFNSKLPKSLRSSSVPHPTIFNQTTSSPSYLLSPRSYRANHLIGKMWVSSALRPYWRGRNVGRLFGIYQELLLGG